MSDAPHRREVWNVQLDKKRPAVVVSRENAISGQKEVIVVPFSATIRLGAPAGVKCSAGEAGLPEDCVALCPLVKAVPKDRLKDKLGDLPDELFRRVLAGIQHAIHADEE